MYKRPDMQYLYLHPDGVIKDNHIENLFADLYESTNLDDITLHNLRHYAAMIFPHSAAVPDDILTDDDAAMRWSLGIGITELTEIIPRHHDDPDIARLGLKYLGKLRLGDQSFSKLPVMGASPGRTALLAVVQWMRGHVDYHNNVTTARTSNASTH